MFNQPLPPFNNVVANGIATMRIPSWDLTLNRIVLALGGTALTKAMLTDIKLKLGGRMIYNCTGAELDAINKYKGIFDQAANLTIDFTERDQSDMAVREIGGYSLPVLRPMGDLTIEVTIAGATAPTLVATGMFNAPQNNPTILKLVKLVSPNASAGRFPINMQFSGALVKRLHMRYTGTDWTTTANGNVNRVEVKKNGLVIHDMTDLDNRFFNQEYRKVPQSRVYVVDFINDNNFRGHLATADARSLEVNAYLTAGDTITTIAEVLDVPTNL